MSEPRLSICIATLNRAAFIGATLDCLIEQSTDDVEIVVLDGCSSDGTEALMRRYEASCKRIRYFRMRQNLGVDRDYDRAVQFARGRYCWLMTDDDVLRPGAIKSVLRALDDAHCLVIVNAEVCNLDLSRGLEPSRLRFGDDRTYEPGELDRLFVDTGQYLTFIGAVVIERELWLARMREPYFGSLFIHVGVIFQQQLPATARVIARPLIAIRYGNAMWRPREFEIWMFKWPSLIGSLPSLSEGAKRAVYPAEPWRDPRRLLFFRAKGTYGIEDYRTWVAPRCTAGWRRALAWGLARMPGAVANIVALAYFHAFEPQQGMAISDLRASRFHYQNWRRARSGSK